MGERGDMKTSQQGLGDMAGDEMQRRAHTRIYTWAYKAASDREKERWSSGANVVSYRISSQSMASRVPSIFQRKKGDERSASRLRFRPPCVSTVNLTQSKPSDHMRNRCM